MDSDNPALDDGSLALSRNGHFIGSQMGLRRSGMGWLLELGSGRKRFFDAMVDRNRLSALGHHARAQRHDEGLEHDPDSVNFLALHFRDFLDPQRYRFVGPCFCPVPHRTLLYRLPASFAVSLSLSPFDPAGFSQERKSTRLSSFP